MFVNAEKETLNILLIEDSKGDAMLIQKSISHALPEACHLVAVQNLESALQILAEQTFDVALLDRSLPDVEGFSGLLSIQNMAPQLPIVFLTAYRDERTAFEAIEQGAQDYLFKDALDGQSIKRAIQYAILRKQFEEVLITRANFDMLTGLANRILFESRLDMALARMRRQGGALALLFIDLDRFKQVNDRLGHAAGDALLKETGCRLQSALRRYDTAARFGGDEFAVLLEGLPRTEHGEIVAQKLITSVSAPYVLSGEAVEVGVSIGIATCNSDDDVTAELLLQQADAAMYEAKSHPESSYCCGDVKGKSAVRVITLSQLRSA